MNPITRSWHTFLQSQSGRILLIGLMIGGSVCFVLSALSVWEVGTFEGFLVLLTSICAIGYGFHHHKIVKQQKLIEQGDINQEEIPPVDNQGVLQRTTAWVSEFTSGLFLVLFLVLILRSFFFEPFRIPSGSMLPTLHLGDFVLVNKYKYGLKLPISGTTILSVSEPKRGDIIVFRFPNDKSLDYIKRVVGIPGDNIKIRDKQVSVNGQLLSTVNKGPYEGKQWQYVGGMAKEYVEKNIDMTEDKQNKGYSILWDINHTYSYEQDYTVPDGHYFVMGDNRSNSNDSRYWGWVPSKNIKGKASYIWLNWFDELDESRIGIGL